jgi:hypothetical protein
VPLSKYDQFFYTRSDSVETFNCLHERKRGYGKGRGFRFTFNRPMAGSFCIQMIEYIAKETVSLNTAGSLDVRVRENQFAPGKTGLNDGGLPQQPFRAQVDPIDILPSFPWDEGALDICRREVRHAEIGPGGNIGRDTRYIRQGAPQELRRPPYWSTENFWKAIPGRV